MFWDHACLPQNRWDVERTPEEWQTFDTALTCMVKFYASLTATCVIQQRHVPERPAAYKLARAFLQRNPTHVEGMRLLADIGSRLQPVRRLGSELEHHIGIGNRQVPVLVRAIHL